MKHWITAGACPSMTQAWGNDDLVSRRLQPAQNP
jgi:hypothetical protein